jgi:hypothetical protein
MEELTEEIQLDHSIFMDKSTIFYGGSGSGKTTVMLDAMWLLQEHIKQIVVISPEDGANQTYSRGLVPLPLIHYKITSDLLNKLWQRQEALVTVYNRANNPIVLDSLFRRINSPITEDVKRLIARMDSRRRSCIDDIRSRYLNTELVEEKIKEITDKFNDLISMIYKKYILEYKDTINKVQLSHEEQFALKYLGLNPRLLIIFDDCSADLQKFKTHPILQKMFFQGRWAKLTIFIALHHNKLLPAEIRSNAHNNIFTEKGTALGLFATKSNNYDAETMKKAINAIRDAFEIKTPDKKYQKLLYMRIENKFIVFTATKRPQFEFGSAIIRDFGHKIQNDGKVIDENNEFYTLFKE